jgi:hypothetical protein
VPKKSKRSSTSPTSDEALNRPIDTTGNDPSPVVNALMSNDFIQASNLDGSQIALLLQQIVRGQDSLLSNQQQMQDEIRLLKEKQERIDMEAVERFAAQKKDIEGILHKASKLKATGDKKDRIVAKGAKMFTDAIKTARASQSSDRLAFEKKMASEPQEMVVSPGQLITAMEGGAQVAKIIPEEVRIKHKLWLLQPGVPTMVPQSVAELLRNRRASQAETAARKELLGKNMEASKLAAGWNNIQGSKTADMPQ